MTYYSDYNNPAAAQDDDIEIVNGALALARVAPRRRRRQKRDRLGLQRVRRGCCQDDPRCQPPHQPRCC